MINEVSTVCLKPVDLRMVPLLDESITLSECANLEYEKNLNNEVNLIDLPCTHLRNEVS